MGSGYSGSAYKESNVPLVYLLANIAGAKGYIAVDKKQRVIDSIRERAMMSGVGENDEDEINKRKEELNQMCSKYGVQRKKAIPLSVVCDDMYNFVRNLPNNSVSFLISGIDEALMYNGVEYMRITMVEAERALSSNGAFLSINHHDFLPSPSSLHSQSLSSFKETGTVFVYKKLQGD